MTRTWWALPLPIAAVAAAVAIAILSDRPDFEPIATPEPKSAGYYESVDTNATGDELRRALHRTISNHRQFNYRETWDALAKIEADPNDPSKLILFYTRRTAPTEHRDTDDRLLWNREHVWAKSRGDFGTRRGPGTDLHMLRPTDVSTNGARGNRAFDDGGELYIDDDGPTLARRDRDSWEPPGTIKGDVARIMFYAAIRYEPPGLDLELTDEPTPQNSNAPVHGRLSALLRWHEADPVDDAERRRNDRVEQVQGNRNPFVDHPEWVKRIWRGVPRPST